jgi:Sulfatase
MAAVGAEVGRVTRRATALAAAVVGLNASLTFGNLWPTLAIRWHLALSIEFAICVLVMAIVSLRSGPPATKTLHWLSALWTLLVLGRYAEVTAPALYGREVNLYWDLRFIPEVAAMATQVAPLRLILSSVAAGALILAVLYFLVVIAWRSVGSALGHPHQRRILIAASSAALVVFAGQSLTGRVPGESVFAAPVTVTYARQMQFVVEAVFESAPVAASPPMNSDLSRVRDADVFLVFIESYGAVSLDHAEIARPLAAARMELESAARAAKREIVSAYVESPTFGGSSWLAHVSLMSGIEVRDPRTNARLMTERRETLVRVFARQGFRTIALMPGLQQIWPEGVFYGFDEIYGADRLAYRGPQFGWFAIPDQYALERLDVLEVARAPRAPLFVFFPTLSTHFPFIPTPPYQPDWSRMSTVHPYDGPEIVRAYERQPDWTDFMPGYIDALSYGFATLAGYLQKNSARDFVMILLGDHQPPALVSGESATWNVPAHVITSRTAIVERLLARGFRRGLTPARPAVARMHALLPILLEAFGDPAS